MLYISDLSKSYLYFVYERHNTACLHKMVHSLFLVFNLKKETQKTLIMNAKKPIFFLVYIEERFSQEYQKWNVCKI